jgi:uncharacterized protein (TIGR00296 family)
LTQRETPQQKPSIEEQLTLAEGKSLVQLALLAITTYLQNSQTIQPGQDISERLRRKSGVFVTLNTVKPVHELRGCIGFPYPEEALITATIKAAIYAATEDPRFPPVLLQEMNDSVVVEVTALTPPRLLEARDRKLLPQLVKVGQHGLIVEGHGRSGLLLPQVAIEWNWDASEFLTNCCLKASLPPDSWLLEGVRVKVFEGEIFGEVEPAGEVRRKIVGET